MTSPITNCYETSKQWRKLNSEMVVLYAPEKDWTYSHHPAMHFFQGKFYATWSNGHVDEDSSGQRVMYSTAEFDAWDAWSEPKVLAKPPMGKHGSEVVLTSAGMHSYSDTLVAYFGQYELLPEKFYYSDPDEYPEYLFAHADTSLWAVSTKDGRNWTEPMNMNCPLVPNLGPERTDSGRLILSGNIMFPYTDDPFGLSGWTPTGIYPEEMKPYIRDDSEYFFKVRLKMGWEPKLCEGSFYQTKDGTINMMLRSAQDRLWVTHSYDDGVTWTAPVKTEFTDNQTKFHFGRWPDGRFYYVGCPDPDPPYVRERFVLSLSEDGVKFDRSYVLADKAFAQQFPGEHKGGIYGYGHTMIHDGWLYVICSIQKEQIAVLRVPCEDL